MNDCIDNVTGLRPGLLALATALVLCACTPARAADEGDFEYWAKVILEIPVTADWEFSFEGRLTFDNDARRVADHQEDYLFTYSGLADWFAVGLGYKKGFGKDGDTWQIEDRPYLNLIVKGGLGGLSIGSRSRFEYRDIKDEDSVWRYRNKITVRPPVTFTPLKVLPYVADEIFISFDEEDFNQHRLYGGLFIPLHERIDLELFYVWKLDEEPDNSWHDTNVLGSFIYFRF